MSEIDATQADIARRLMAYTRTRKPDEVVARAAPPHLAAVTALDVASLCEWVLDRVRKARRGKNMSNDVTRRAKERLASLHPADRHNLEAVIASSSGVADLRVPQADRLAGIVIKGDRVRYGRQWWTSVSLTEDLGKEIARLILSEGASR